MMHYLFGVELDLRFDALYIWRVAGLTLIDGELDLHYDELITLRELDLHYDELIIWRGAGFTL